MQLLIPGYVYLQLCLQLVNFLPVNELGGVLVLMFVEFAYLVPFVAFVLFGIQTRSNLAVSPRGEFQRN